MRASMLRKSNWKINRGDIRIGYLKTSDDALI